MLLTAGSTSATSQVPSATSERAEGDLEGVAAKRKRPPSQRIAQVKMKKSTESNGTKKNTTVKKDTTAKKNAATKSRTTTKSNTKTKSNTTAERSAPSGSTEDKNRGEPFLQRVKRGIDAIFAEFLTFVNAKGGLHSIEWDAIRTGSWIIVASTGAVSETHHDASGFVTWIKCDLGGKIWGYVVRKTHSERLPEEHPEDPSGERLERSEERPDNLASEMKTYYDILSKNTEPVELAEIAKPLQTLLRPGDMV